MAARSGQYTPARRVVMQLAMFAVLLGVVALAAAVSQYRTRDLRGELSQRRQLGPVVVSLPEGWALGPAGGTGPGISVGTIRDEDDESLESEEPDPSSATDVGGGDTTRLDVQQEIVARERQGSRRLVVRVSPTGGGDAVDVEEALISWAQVESEGIEPLDFTGLGQQGVMVEVRARYIDTSTGRLVDLRGLYACAPLSPAGGGAGMVFLKLIGEESLGPTSRRLLERVAESIRRVGDDGEPSS